jgi:MFS family permease
VKSRFFFENIPRSIWALGLVSLFMDASSELVHSLLSAYMVTALGASVTSVGLIEGVAEATAMIVKVFSGTLSDLLGRRKLLTVVGYGLAAVTKPLFPRPTPWGWCSPPASSTGSAKGFAGRRETP